jgi:hypothetical protein
MNARGVAFQDNKVHSFDYATPKFAPELDTGNFWSGGYLLHALKRVLSIVQWRYIFSQNTG